MKYTEKLLEHPKYLALMQEIHKWEEERIYCHHELEHALDVCRIAWIMYLEYHAADVVDKELLEEKKDIFYLTGLLHDVGRTAQYAEDRDHTSAGASISEEILEELAIPQQTKEEILMTIRRHSGRHFSQFKADFLGHYITLADQFSRNCFACQAQDTCKWDREERNKTIIY